jgi:hypothetical protein
MANELNKMLDEDATVRPAYGQPNGFLIGVVAPLYNVVKAVCGYFHLLSSWSSVLLSVGAPGGWKFKPLLNEYLHHTKSIDVFFRILLE